jgi:phosphopantothenoylcysteine decarboxylase/phosphopantothenate--cysteine ligase
VKVLLGVTGGISAYKSAEIVRGLRERGDDVQVIFTRSAAEFVAPLTFSALSGKPVLEHVFERPAPGQVRHVELASWGDLLLVAPATADVIARFSHGIADDLLSTVYLAFAGPVLLAPAMETSMWLHPAVADNVETLRRRGVRLVGPEEGPLASGRSGRGRMAEPDDVVCAATLAVEGKDDLAGARVLVTAGPTRESIDPVRFVSNRSSGRMGMALAEAARDRGAAVALLLGPTELPVPRGVTVRRFETAGELGVLLDEEFEACDVLAMAAAVSDFVPERASRRIHRSEGARSLVLSPGRDLLESIGARKGGRIVVAFAAEEGPGEEGARRKMEAKDADWIVVNDVTRPGTGFEAADNEVLLLSRSGSRIEISRRPKRQVAEAIWDAVSSEMSWAGKPGGA